VNLEEMQTKDRVKGLSRAGSAAEEPAQGIALAAGNPALKGSDKGFATKLKCLVSPRLEDS
jgi:hypothetical protein